MFIVCKFGLWCGFDLVNSVGVIVLLYCIVSSFVNFGVCLTLTRRVGGYCVYAVGLLLVWLVCGGFTLLVCLFTCGSGVWLTYCCAV